MPAYDFYCEQGEKVEIIASGIDAGMQEKCPTHGCKLIGLASTPNMQPDPLWAGKKFDGLFNHKGEDFYYSKSKLQEAMKANTKMWNEPGLDKDVERNAVYKKESQRKKVKAKLKNMVNNMFSGEIRS